jgi:hypothetical protein
MCGIASQTKQLVKGGSTAVFSAVDSAVSDRH